MSNIEDHIRKAMEEGKFDDLPGKGKPLNLDENPFEDPEWRLANRALKNGGFTLPWIEKRAEIAEMLDSTRKALSRTWKWRQAQLDQGQALSAVDPEWQRAMAAFQEQVTAINKRILSYNLEAPSGRFQLLPVRFERELETVMKDISSHG